MCPAYAMDPGLRRDDENPEMVKIRQGFLFLQVCKEKFDVDGRS